MRLSLDTHTFLWMLSEPNRLPLAVRQAVTDISNDVFVSVVVFWEIVIKMRLGKLQLPRPAAEWLPRELQGRRMTPIEVTLAHVLGVEDLPLHHRDPFDRLLVAQARVEGLLIVSRDPAIAEYGVPVLWQ